MFVEVVRSVDHRLRGVEKSSLVVRQVNHGPRVGVEYFWVWYSQSGGSGRNQQRIGLAAVSRAMCCFGVASWTRLEMMQTERLAIVVHSIAHDRGKTVDTVDWQRERYHSIGQRLMTCRPLFTDTIERPYACRWCERVFGGFGKLQTGKAG